MRIWQDLGSLLGELSVIYVVNFTKLNAFNSLKLSKGAYEPYHMSKSFDEVHMKVPRIYPISYVALYVHKYGI